MLLVTDVLLKHLPPPKGHVRHHVTETPSSEELGQWRVLGNDTVAYVAQLGAGEGDYKGRTSDGVRVTCTSSSARARTTAHTMYGQIQGAVCARSVCKHAHA